MGRLKIRANVLKVDIASQYVLLNEVIVHFDMLCMHVEHRVPSQIDIAHVVTEKGSRILDGKTPILQYPLEPYDFTCGHHRAPIFRLCARKSDDWLLLAAPGYGFATEGENKSGGCSSIGFVAGPIVVCVPLESNWC